MKLIEMQEQGGKQINPCTLSGSTVFASLCQDKNKIPIIQVCMKIKQHFPLIHL